MGRFTCCDGCGADVTYLPEGGTPNGSCTLQLGMDTRVRLDLCLKCTLELERSLFARWNAPPRPGQAA